MSDLRTKELPRTPTVTDAPQPNTTYVRRVASGISRRLVLRVIRGDRWTRVEYRERGVLNNTPLSLWRIWARGAREE